MTTPKLSRRAALVLAGSALIMPRAAWPQNDPREIEGGIGGTGIVGLLTDFGSLIVGGEYVQTDDQTEFGDAFGLLAKRDLNIGDSLTVEASGPRNGLVARRVRVTHPLVGQISKVSSAGRRVIVNGVSVELDTASKFTVGDRVAVSGLWRGDIVQASRLSPARAQRDLVAGDLRRTGGSKHIGSVQVNGGGIRKRAIGSFATAIGTFDGTQLRAQSIEANRFTGAAGPLVWLSVEGYLEPTPQRPGYRVSGLGHSFSRNLQLDAFARERVLLNGAYTGTFAANNAIVLPGDFGGQRRLLNRIVKQRW